MFRVKRIYLEELEGPVGQSRGSTDLVLMVIFWFLVFFLVGIDLNKIFATRPFWVRRHLVPKNEQNRPTLTQFHFHVFQLFWVFSTDSKRVFSSSGDPKKILKNFKKYASQAAFKNMPLRKTANFRLLCSGGFWFLNNETYPLL